VKLKLAGLWTAMMFLYVYAVVLSFYRPGELAEIERGKLGPVDVSQSSLVVASLIVILPALMTALSLPLRAALHRTASLAPGLPLAFARAQRVDPSRSLLVGTSPAHRTLAAALGATFVDAEPTSAGR